MKKLYVLTLILAVVSIDAYAQRSNDGARSRMGRAGVARGKSVSKINSSVRAADLQETSQQVIVNQEVQTTQPAGLTAEVPTVAQINYVNEALVKELEDKTKLRDQLKLEIAQIDGEQVRCDKDRKGWIAGTIIGSVGTVGTAVGVGIQADQMKKKKDILNAPAVETPTVE